jgi:dTDP-3-amino-3,4,6-trideoxy-alpha-D-glucose transaminase
LCWQGWCTTAPGLESHMTATLTATLAPSTVPFMALERTHAALRPELEDAFRRVVGSSSFILGTEVEAFEREFASYCGAEHCVGVASGTAALTLALSAAGVSPGDEVIVPAHTFIASALGVIHAGATPVLCDVEPATGLVDPASAEACVSDRTAALLAVHLYGQPCDMDAVLAVAARHGLFVLEDAAQAHGARSKGRVAGSLGHAAAFSFYPSKNLGALGDGGAICTDDDELADRARQLRHLGQRGKGEHVAAGYNERLDGLQAALLRAKLPHLDSANEARRGHARRYSEALPASVGRLREEPDRTCNFHLYPVRVANRDGVAVELKEHGVATGVHYAPALHEQPPVAAVARRPVPLDAAAAWADEELSLPMFPELSQAEVDHVSSSCQVVLESPDLGGRAQ